MAKLRLTLSPFCGLVMMLIASMAGAQATNTFPSTGNVGIGTTSPASPLTLIQTSTGNPPVWGTAPSPGNGQSSFVNLLINPTADQDPTTLQSAAVNFAQIPSSNSHKVSTVLGSQSVAENFGSFDTAGLYGQFNWAWNQQANITGANSSGGEVGSGDWAESDGGTVSGLTGTYAWTGSYGGHVLSDYGVLVQMDQSGSQVDGRYGLYIDAFSGTASKDYGVYQVGASQANFFAGNVGIGTSSPAYNLDVAGKIHTSTAVIFPDGSQQTTAWTGTVCGGDYAESVDVTGRRKSYEPGDVLVIDADAPGNFLKSVEPYSTAVAGIYSTKPGLVGRREGAPTNPDAVPMAMVGIVPTKVVAENGPIHPGDLLVTSSTLGYAMKGTDRSKMLGAVIGKALGSLDSGKGVIEVVVMLQ